MKVTGEPSYCRQFFLAYARCASVTTADIVYGQPLRLPGEPLVNSTASNKSPIPFLGLLRRYFQQLNVGAAIEKLLLYKDTLPLPYNRLFLVLCRSDRSVNERIKGRNVLISIELLNLGLYDRGSARRDRVAAAHTEATTTPLTSKRTERVSKKIPACRNTTMIDVTSDLPIDIKQATSSFFFFFLHL